MLFLQLDQMAKQLKKFAIDFSICLIVKKTERKGHIDN